MLFTKVKSKERKPEHKQRKRFALANLRTHDDDVSIILSLSSKHAMA